MAKSPKKVSVKKSTPKKGKASPKKKVACEDKINPKTGENSCKHYEVYLLADVERAQASNDKNKDEGRVEPIHSFKAASPMQAAKKAGVAAVRDARKGGKTPSKKTYSETIVVRKTHRGWGKTYKYNAKLLSEDDAKPVYKFDKKIEHNGKTTTVHTVESQKELKSLLAKAEKAKIHGEELFQRHSEVTVKAVDSKKQINFPKITTRRRAGVDADGNKIKLKPKKAKKAKKSPKPKAAKKSPKKSTKAKKATKPKAKKSPKKASKPKAKKSPKKASKPKAKKSPKKASKPKAKKSPKKASKPKAKKSPKKSSSSSIDSTY